MANEKEAKLKALQLTLDKLDKAYGKGTVMRMNDEALVEVEAISSGSLSLDAALGVGGYPRGRLLKYMDQGIRKNYTHSTCHSGMSKKWKLQHLLMPNMPLIATMRKAWA